MSCFSFKVFHGPFGGAGSKGDIKSRELDPRVSSLPPHLENNLRRSKGSLGWVIKSCRSHSGDWKLELQEAAGHYEIYSV